MGRWRRIRPWWAPHLRLKSEILLRGISMMAVVSAAKQNEERQNTCPESTMTQSRESQNGRWPQQFMLNTGESSHHESSSRWSRDWKNDNRWIDWHNYNDHYPNGDMRFTQVSIFLTLHLLASVQKADDIRWDIFHYFLGASNFSASSLARFSRFPFHFLSARMILRVW